MLKTFTLYLSWPAKAGHPGGDKLNRRTDVRLLDGPVEPGHDM